MPQVEASAGGEREVFDLLFYQGLPQAEAAAILGTRSGPSSGAGRRRGCGARGAGGRLPGV